jgi:hypothetical protein
MYIVCVLRVFQIEDASNITNVGTTIHIGSSVDMRFTNVHHLFGLVLHFEHIFKKRVIIIIIIIIIIIMKIMMIYYYVLEK